ncbi:AAA family ATPase [Microgenomates group bacterium RBG_16_45_19]|nr:MAG: AAA family ATPase [Microgenomates group bacterium RBG_16_45_19]
MQPLADRIRPKSLKEFVGQSHLVGEGKPMALMVKRQQPTSMIFWGPPGSGKTTLAKIVAEATGYRFVYLSAVSAGKADIKKIIETKESHPRSEGFFHSGGEIKDTILFLDEIHRFNKAQQDYLLPFVESGQLVLIGATTENPSFEVIAPLMSRTQVFVLNELSTQELAEIVKRGLTGLTPKVKIEAAAKEYLITYANGDARKALNLLENTAQLYPKGEITLDRVKNALQSAYIRYDKGGEEHYNTISAFIKSMRASNVDAALYYLARMVKAGEDPLFIARRMVVFASEDVAAPTALVVANAVFRACETIGYPECQENLAAGVVYLSQAKKDRSAYDAYMAALSDVQTFGNLPIPMEIRNAPTRLMKNLGYGKGYQKYTQASLLPEKLKGRKYYH